MAKGDGGAAFPSIVIHEDGTTGIHTWTLQGGMSLRDWFAGQALAGLLTDPRRIVSEEEIRRGPLAATWAYAYADAMLTERGKP